MFDVEKKDYKSPYLSLSEEEKEAFALARKSRIPFTIKETRVPNITSKERGPNLPEAAGSRMEGGVPATKEP